MISFISSWAQQIIFAVIIGVIIQMLIPEGKNKKYIKVVIGIYVLFTVISPVVGKNIDIDLSKYNIDINKNTNKVETNTQENINEIYVSNLKQDITVKLKNRGYECTLVELKTNENYEVENIKVSNVYKIEEDDDAVNKIVINEIQIGSDSTKKQKEKDISNNEKIELKKYLSETYDVKETNISIN